MLIIPVFVSSTFRDFQTERDILTGRVQDRLNETLRQYGARMQFIDLRWGVDTGEMEPEEAQRKALDVCLDEVTRANPHFLGLIGSRYGWVSQDTALLEWTAGRAGLDPERARDCSITELEFAKAGLWVTDATTSPFVLVRAIEGQAPIGWQDADPARISAFRQQVLSRWGETGKVRSYSVQVAPDGHWSEVEQQQQFEDLAVELFENTLVDQVRSTAPAGPSEEVLFRGARTRLFGRDWALQFLQTMRQARLSAVVLGGSGTGKSTLLLAFEQLLIDSGSTPVTAILGLDDRVWTGDELAFEISQQLGKRVGLSLFDTGRGDPDTWRQRWRDTMQGALADRSDLVFIVDGLDHLVDSVAGFWPLEWLMQRVPMSVSTRSEAHGQLLKKHNFQRVELDSVPSPDVREMLEDWERQTRREIGGAARALIASKDRTPLWVELALDELLDIDSDDFASIATEEDQAGAIVRMLGDRAWLIPDDMPDAVYHFLETSIDSTDRVMARAAVGMLGAARIGSSQEQVAQALRISGFEGNVEYCVARLFRSLGGQLVPSGPEGRMRFGHQIFDDAAASFSSDLTHFALMRTYEPELHTAIETTPTWAPVESVQFAAVEAQWKVLRRIAGAFLYHLFHCPPSQVPEDAMSLPLAFDSLPQTTEHEVAVVTSLLHLPYAMDHLRALRYLDTSLEAIRTLVAAALQTPDPRVKAEVANICASALESYVTRGHRVDAMWVDLHCKTLTLLSSFASDPLEAQWYLHALQDVVTPLLEASPNDRRILTRLAVAQRQMALLFAQDGQFENAETLLESCLGLLLRTAEAADPETLEEGARAWIQLAGVQRKLGKDVYALTSLEQAQEWAWSLRRDGDGPSIAHALVAQALELQAEVWKQILPAQAMSLLQLAAEEFTYAAQRVPFGTRFIADAMRNAMSLAALHIARDEETEAYRAFLHPTKAVIPLLSEADAESWNGLARAVEMIDRIGRESSAADVRQWYTGYMRANVPRMLAQAPTDQPPTEAIAIALLAHDALGHILRQAKYAEEVQRTQQALTKVVGHLERLHRE